MNAERITLAAVVSIVFMFTALAPAAEPDSNAICTAMGEQSYPAVSGNYIVWQDKRSGGYDIYRNNGANANDANSYIVCNTPSDQKFPAISGNTVIWQDARISTSNVDIFHYSLPSGPEAGVCNYTGKQDLPAISGDIVVWRDNRTGNNDIYGYRISNSTEFAICTDGSSQSYPAISGNIVVWQDNRNTDADIYGKNLQTGEDFIVKQLSGNDQYNPAISGNIVVWQDNRNGDTDIYGKNISTGEEIEICKYAGSEQINPAINGDIVVWEDRRNGDNNIDIYGYRISTHAIFPICTRAGNQKNPAIDGNFVVWEEYLYDTSGDIYGAHIPEPVAPSRITVIDPNGGEMFLAGSSDTITWQTTGTPITHVEIKYSTDNGTNYSTIDDNYANTGSYEWQVPSNIDSNQCKIKITDKAIPPAASDISNNVFTIFQCDPNLTADISGDCKVDFMDFALLSGQWLDCGNLRDPAWCP